VSLSLKFLSKGYPDVSAQGDNYRIFVGGQSMLVGGTSAATPTFSAIVALLNDVQLRQGKKPLGFLNPLLYSLPGGNLNDITEGQSAGCGTTGFNVRIKLYLQILLSQDVDIGY
jgi:tripeptidyl-peptidase-1